MSVHAETKKPAIPIMTLLALLEEIPRNAEIVQSKTGNLTFWISSVPVGVILLKEERIVYFKDLVK